jgi:hypothetical protein
MITRKPISAEQPEPLFSSFTLWERCLLGATTITVLFGTPYILFTMWSIR